LIAWSAIASIEHQLVYAAGHDITERRKAEEDRDQFEKSLRHSQKMEAVGQLAGGVAHDYNNMLGVIMGNLDLLHHRVGEDPKALKYLETAREGARRGAKITRKLLDFSRTEAGDQEVTEVNEFILGMKDLIIRSITQAITVETQLADGLGPADIAAGDFEDER